MRQLASIVVLPCALLAQLPFAATYDTTRQITLQGSVIQIDWVNPHAFVTVEVREPNGTTITDWAVEIGNPLDLERSGYTRNTVHIGDLVTVQGNPARGQAKQLFGTRVMRQSEILFVVQPRPEPGPKQATPRWPDGHPRLGAEPGTQGYWGPPSVHGLYEDNGQEISITAEGLLTNLTQVDRVAPFQPWSRALYMFRQRNRLQDDPYATKCIPPGGPRQFLTPHGVQFVEQPELGRILVLFGGGDRNWRVIYTDGRPVAQPDEVVQTYYGTSVGHWEGDTLVVDSVGYNERFWFSPGGLPHTEALHLEESFTRQDRDTLRYEVTVDDPRAYTHPWKASWEIGWVPDQEIEEFFCEENAESTFRR